MTAGAGPVVVYGATGHTGRFVIAELMRRGISILASGRDSVRLAGLLDRFPEVQLRPAGAEDPDALDLAFAGATAVINCAGPFAITAGPVVEAALRAGIPYVDVAAEIEANVAMFADYGARAEEAGVVVIPAMAFYGGLSDLMVTAAMTGWETASSIDIAYGLSSWHPTSGTREAGRVSRERRAGRNVRYTQGTLQYNDLPATEQDWQFPPALGSRRVLEGFTMTDVVTIPSHIPVSEVTTYMAIEAARDVADPATPGPKTDGGRSDQRFVVDAIIRRGSERRRAVAQGHDIYAATAPIVVEAIVRILDGRIRATGVQSAGAAFDARSFLQSLAPEISIQILDDEREKLIHRDNS